MIKRLVALAFFLFNCSGFATTICPSALPTTDPNFCTSFKTAATCYCSNTLPQKMCENIDKIYQLMIAQYGSIEIACKFQKETPTQTCIDDWRCYRTGGKDSQGGLCSNTGLSCH